MTAAGILARLRDLGVTARADGDALRLRPASAVTDELLAELRAHKADLLLLLDTRAAIAAETMPPASPEQTEAEAADRAAMAAEGAPAVTAPVPPAELAAWETELAAMLAAAPGQRILDPEKAAAYFTAESRRRLALVRHDRQAAGLLLGFWRDARHRTE